MDAPSGNRLFDALPRADAASILEAARVVHVKRGETTTVEGDVMQNVDFPLTALLAVSGTLENGTVYEVASIGSEAFVEIDAALDSQIAKRTAACQFDGDVVRLSLRDFQSALDRSKPFARLVRRAVRARVFVTEQTAMCNLKHYIVQRLARWLLLARDRLDRQDFQVTHEFVATILGVRRAGVSAAAAALEERGAIKQLRGTLMIAEAGLLYDAVCECYDICRLAISESMGGPNESVE